MAPGFYTALKRPNQAKLKALLLDIEEGVEGINFHKAMSTYALQPEQVRDAWQWVHHGKKAVYANGGSSSSTGTQSPLQLDNGARTEEDEWLREGKNYDSIAPPVFRMQNVGTAATGNSASGYNDIRRVLENLDIFPSARASTLKDLRETNEVRSCNKFYTKGLSIRNVCACSEMKKKILHVLKVLSFPCLFVFCAHDRVVSRLGHSVLKEDQQILEQD